MSWPVAIGFVSFLVTASFLLYAADDPRFFRFSKLTAKVVDKIAFGSIVLAGVILAIATATSLLNLLQKNG